MESAESCEKKGIYILTFLLSFSIIKQVLTKSAAVWKTGSDEEWTQSL